MIFLNTLIVIWFVSIVPCYLLMRREINQSSIWEWNNASRIGIIIAAFFIAPYYLLGLGITWVADKVADSSWGKRDAKW